MIAAVDAPAAVSPNRQGEKGMQVTAISTPTEPRWRWRVVNYAGEIVEESRDLFPTISMAVAKGTEWVVQMKLVDRSAPVRHWRPTSHTRSR